MNRDHDHISALAEKMKGRLLQELPDVQFNGSEVARYVGNLNFTFEDVRADQLIKGLRDIALSTGSACSTEKVEPSHVLSALGLDKKQIDCSVRIGIGRMTTAAEIDFAIDKIITTVTNIRAGE